MRRLALSSTVLKDLPDLQPKQYRQVVDAIFALLVDPAPHYSAQLAGYPYRRLAVGEFRVIYRYDAELVQVLVVGKRNDDEIYKRLNRLSSA